MGSCQSAVASVREWIEHSGVPRALCTDWKNVYVRPPTEEGRLTETAPLTQFGRMCAQLGIRIVPASWPQAKGRIERNQGTHQDRLIKKLRLAGIAALAGQMRFCARDRDPSDGTIEIRYRDRVMCYQEIAASTLQARRAHTAHAWQGARPAPTEPRIARHPWPPPARRRPSVAPALQSGTGSAGAPA